MRRFPSSAEYTLPRTWVSFLEMLNLPTSIQIRGKAANNLRIPISELAYIELISGDQKRDKVLGMNEILSNDQGLKEAIFQTRDTTCTQQALQSGECQQLLYRLSLKAEEIFVDMRYFNFYKIFQNGESTITVANFNEDYFDCLDKKLTAV